MKCAKYNICVINHWACHRIDFWSATFWATCYGAVEALGEGGERGEVVLQPATEAWDSSHSESHCQGAVAEAIPLTSWYTSRGSSSTSWDMI